MDLLRAFGDLPGVSLTYAVSPGRVLSVVVAPAPGTGEADAWQRAYDALAAGDVTVTLVTSLAPSPLPVARATLLRYAAAGLLSARGAAVTDVGTPLTVPYTVRDGEGLADVAALFGTTPAALAEANAAMPGALLPGHTVVAPAAKTATVAGDTIATVAARLGNAPLADVAAALDGLLAPGAVLACPPPAVPGTEPASPAAVAAAYGVGAVPLLDVNASVAGLVAEGVALEAGGETVTTLATDTLRTLAARLGASAGDVLAADVLAAEVLAAEVLAAEVVAAFAGVAFLAPGARLLLPPAPVTLTAPLPEALPGEAAFPLEVVVALRLARGTERVDSAAVPDVTAAAFEAAYPEVRLATGGTRAWVVDPATPASLAFGPATRAFALRPLHNVAPPAGDVPADRVREDGTLVPAGTLRVDAYDSEAGARRLLGDVDQFRARPAPPAVAERVAASAGTLAGAAARGVWPVLDVPDAGTGLDAAVAGLEALLRAGLLRGYDTASVVQYDATLAPPGDPLPGVRLHAGTSAPPGAPYVPSRTSVDAAVATSYASVPLHARGAPAASWTVGRLRFAVDAVSVGEGPAAFRPGEPVAGAPAAPVPVPLRGQPAAPVATAEAVPPAAGASLADAVRWTYAVTVAYAFAPQDEVTVTVRLVPEPPPVNAVRAAEADGLAAALARYSAVAEPLREILAAGGDDARRANAAASFATCVERVAQAWDAHWQAPPALSVSPPAAAAGTCSVTVRVSYERGTVELRSSDPAPGGGWPEVAWPRPDGPVTLPPDSSVAGVRTYAIPAGADPAAPATLVLSWPGLLAATHQGASATVSVRRNERLLGPDGPATSAAFVYAPAPVAVAPVVPSYDVPGDLDVTGLGPLPGALAAVFAEVAGGAAVTGSVEVSYEYEIAPGMSTSLPVLAAPAVPLDAATAGDVAAQAAAWLAAKAPERAAAAFVCAVTLWDSAGTAPLLRLRRVVHRLG